MYYVLIIGMLFEIILFEVVKRKLFENFFEVINVCKRKCINFRESYINLSSRVEIYLYLNVLLIYDDINIDDRVKIIYYVKKKCREGIKFFVEKKVNCN